MKKIAALILVIIGAFVLSQNTYASYMTFDPTSYTPSVGSIISVPIIIDTEGVETRAADIYINYDSTMLEPTTIEKGSFYRNILNQTLDNRIYLAVYESDPTLNVKGRDVVAKLNFRVKTAGSSKITYECDQGKQITSQIIEASANNYKIIECSKYGTATINANNQTTTSSSSTTTTTTIITTQITAKPTPTITKAVIVTANNELPKSGATENVLTLASVGGVLSIIGYAIRFIRL